MCPRLAQCLVAGTPHVLGEPVNERSCVLTSTMSFFRIRDVIEYVIIFGQENYQKVFHLQNSLG